jgi:FeS assembly SUF system regulator
VLRISKLTDYGIVLLARFAREAPGTTLTAREMAESTSLPHPVVSKMLKTLASAELLRSHRGAKGGYSLVREPQRITVADILHALEGPLALMECSAGPGHCGQESSCGVREPWQRINQTVHAALRAMTLAELAGPARPPLLGIGGERSAAPAARS